MSVKERTDKMNFNVEQLSHQVEEADLLSEQVKLRWEDRKFEKSWNKHYGKWAKEPIKH